jgi:hypothetical protein
MIKIFNFEIIVNSSFKFYSPLAKIAGLEPKNFHLGQYVLEMALLKPKFLAYEPSLIASATVYLIKKIRKSESPWSEAVSRAVGYREN